MRLTTDANDSVKLADIVSGHRADLQNRIALVEASDDQEKGLLVDRLKQQLQKLDDQASKAKQENS